MANNTATSERRASGSCCQLSRLANSLPNRHENTAQETARVPITPRLVLESVNVASPAGRHWPRQGAGSSLLRVLATETGIMRYALVTLTVAVWSVFSFAARASAAETSAGACQLIPSGGRQARWQAGNRFTRRRQDDRRLVAGRPRRSAVQGPAAGLFAHRKRVR